MLGQVLAINKSIFQALVNSLKIKVLFLKECTFIKACFMALQHGIMTPVKVKWYRAKILQVYCNPDAVDLIVDIHWSQKSQERD